MNLYDYYVSKKIYNISTAHSFIALTMALEKSMIYLLGEKAISNNKGGNKEMLDKF